MRANSRLKKLLLHAEALRHLRVLEAFTGDIGLHPFTIDHKLRNGPLAGVLDHLFRGAWYLFNIDLTVSDLVLVEPPFCFPAVAAPRGGIDNEFHSFIFAQVR